MTFLLPAALLGLLLIPVLVLLDRWRRRPRERVWPSLLLWEGVGEAEAASRRRVDPLLVYECAAVALLSLAAAGPVVGVRAAGLSVVVLKDTGAHMEARRADGRTAGEATWAEVERIRAGLSGGDDMKTLSVASGLARAAASLPAADFKVVATSRPLDGPGYRVVGRAADGFNLGLDAVDVSGDTLWFAVATDGEPREVEVEAGDRRLTVRTGTGVSVPFAPSLRIVSEDNCDVDDLIRLRRPTLAARHDTGSPLVEAALFHAGTKATRAAGGLFVTGAGGAPLEGVVRGSECIAGPGIFEGLLLDECRWRAARAREGPGLLTHEGFALARWLEPGTLWLGLPVDREWDDHGTLAVLLERAKRARLDLGPGEALVGDAIASPAPGHVDTRGRDRPWDGRLPAARRRASDGLELRAVLAVAAALLLALYARAMVQRP